MSFQKFASKKLNHVFNTCFVNEIRYEKTTARVSRFLVNAEQASKRSSLHMSAYCFKYLRCVSIKFSLIVLKFSMYTPVSKSVNMRLICIVLTSGVAINVYAQKRCVVACHPPLTFDCLKFCAAEYQVKKVLLGNNFVKYIILFHQY